MKSTLTAIIVIAFLQTACDHAPGTVEEKVTFFEPAPGTNEIDSSKVSALVESYRSRNDTELGAAMNDPDYNKRAAAARIRLERDGISATAGGIETIRTRYLGDPNRAAYGFWLLGNIAAQGAFGSAIRKVVLDWVEKHPHDPICDQALWALGETGSDEALEEFFKIAGDLDRYGPQARERSFCCISQCGRYSGRTRFEKIPRILELAKKHRDHQQTQGWCRLALHDMAPSVNAHSLEEWGKWWEAQQKLR